MTIQTPSRKYSFENATKWVAGFALLLGLIVDVNAEEWFDEESPPIGNFRVLFPTDAIGPDSLDEGLGFQCSDIMPVQQLSHQHEWFGVTVMQRSDRPDISDFLAHLDSLPTREMADARTLVDNGEVRLIELSEFDTGRIRCSGYPGFQSGVYRCTSRGGITNYAWNITREIATDDQFVILSYYRNRNDRYIDINPESDSARAQHRRSRYFRRLISSMFDPRPSSPGSRPGDSGSSLRRLV